MKFLIIGLPQNLGVLLIFGVLSAVGLLALWAFMGVKIEEFLGESESNSRIGFVLSSITTAFFLLFLLICK